MTATWLWPATVLGIAITLLCVVMSYDNAEVENIWSCSSDRYSREVIHGLGEIMIAVLGMQVSATFIILEIASGNFLHHITTLFFRDLTVLCTLSVFVGSSMVMIGVDFTAHSDEMIQNGSVYSCVIVVVMCILILNIFFHYLIDFLDPAKVINKIALQMFKPLSKMTSLRGSCGRSREAMGEKQIVRARRTVHDGLKLLVECGRGAIDNLDNFNAVKSADAILRSGSQYWKLKAGLPQSWFLIPDEMWRTSDFTAMPFGAIREMETNRVWLEWKLLKQFQTLFMHGLGLAHDVCEVVAINTRCVATEALLRRDYAVINLSVKFMNAYLRAAITQTEIRTAISVVQQYRKLSEALLRASSTETSKTHHEEKNTPSSSSNSSDDNSSDKDKRDTEEIVVRIASHLQFYSVLSLESKMCSFLAVTMAHDLAALCELAFALHLDCHGDLLNILLTIDDGAEKAAAEDILQGIRKAQIMLATSYITAAQVTGVQEERVRTAWEHVGAVQADMHDEHPARLCDIWNELNKMEGRENWEVVCMNDSDCLTPLRRAALPEFFASLKGFQECSSKWTERARRLSCIARTGQPGAHGRRSNATSALRTASSMMDQNPQVPVTPDPSVALISGSRNRPKGPKRSAPARSRRLSSAVSQRKRKLTAPDVTILNRPSHEEFPPVTMTRESFRASRESANDGSSDPRSSEACQEADDAWVEYGDIINRAGTGEDNDVFAQQFNFLKPQPMGGVRLKLVAYVAIPTLSIIMLCIAVLLNRINLPDAEVTMRHMNTSARAAFLQHKRMQPLLQLVSSESTTELLRTMAFVAVSVLGLILDASVIILQITTTKYHSHPTVQMFFEDPTILGMVGFLATVNMYIIFLFTLVGTGCYDEPVVGVGVALGCTVLSIVLVLPYFTYLFTFLAMESMTLRVLSQGLMVATWNFRLGCRPERFWRSEYFVDRFRECRLEACVGVERIADFGLSALRQKDKHNTLIATDSLERLCTAHAMQRHAHLRYCRDNAENIDNSEGGAVPCPAHPLPKEVRDSPDFFLLSSATMSDLCEHETWYGWKILRQLLMLFHEGLGIVPDISLAIAINSRHIAEHAASFFDMGLLKLSLKFFNTFVRMCIDRQDERTLTGVVQQYCRLGCFLMAGNEALTHYAVQIAEFLRYYSVLCLRAGMYSSLELIADHVSWMCWAAFDRAPNSTMHRQLLIIFLSIDDIQEVTQTGPRATSSRASVQSESSPKNTQPDAVVLMEKAMRGVRAAQIKLATRYLLSMRQDFAQNVAEDMAGEDTVRLTEIWRDLMTTDDPEYWEVCDRGMSIDHLTPGLRSMLPRFFEIFKLCSTSDAPGAQSLMQAPGGHEIGSAINHTAKVRFAAHTLQMSESPGAEVYRKRRRSKPIHMPNALKRKNKKGRRKMPLNTTSKRFMPSNFLPAESKSNASPLERFGWLLSLVLVPTTLVVGCMLLVSSDLRHASEGDAPSFVAVATGASVADSRKIVLCLCEAVSGLTMLTLSASYISLQICASNRSGNHVISLFFRNPYVLMYITWYLASCIFVYSLAVYTRKHDYTPGWDQGIGLFVCVTDVLLLYPYFVLLLRVVNAKTVVLQMACEALYKTQAQCFSRTQQETVVQAIERLGDFGSSSLQTHDKHNLFLVLRVLSRFAMAYAELKPYVPVEWHHIEDFMRNRPDFIILSESAVSTLADSRTWVEWKLLKQCRSLFLESCRSVPDGCYHVALQTRRIAETAAAKGDHHLFELTLRFMNSYLREAINCRNVRVALGVMHQYRMLGEFVVCHRAGSKTSLKEAELESFAMQICRYFRHYACACIDIGLNCVAETIAHDLGTLVRVAVEYNCKCHSALLQIFLTLDDHAESNAGEATLRGVRRAQIKLATHLLVAGHTGLAELIREDMVDEPPSRLRSIWVEMLSHERREFWEVAERGGNDDFLQEAQRATLPHFFAFFNGLHPDRIDESAREAEDNEVTELMQAELAQLAGGPRSESFKEKHNRLVLAAAAEGTNQLASQLEGWSRRRGSILQPGLPGRRKASMACSGAELDLCSQAAMAAALAGHLASGPDLWDIKGQLVVRVGRLWVLSTMAMPCCALLMLGVVLLLGGTSPGDVDWEEILTLGQSGNIGDAQYHLDGLAKVMTMQLTLVLTSSLIVLQVAASAQTHHSTTILLKDRAFGIILLVLLTNTLLVIVVNFLGGAVYQPRRALLFCNLLTASCSMLLIPYFVHLFSFLNPASLLFRIDHQLRRSCECARRATPREAHIQQWQRDMILTVHTVYDFSSVALQQMDKSVAVLAIAVLDSILVGQREFKELADNVVWEELYPQVLLDHDFENLPSNQVEKLRKQHIWVEWKILRQYQMLFTEGLRHMKDSCQHIMVSTRHLAESAMADGDKPLLKLAVKFANTFLRDAIDAGEQRTLYNVLHQYRLIGEALVAHGNAWGDQLVCLMKYFRYYGVRALQMNLEVIVEVIAHDMGSLTRAANKAILGGHATGNEADRVHAKLLHIFLTVDDHAEKQGDETCLRGVRRAQIKLATHYILTQQDDHVMDIVGDFVDEPWDRLKSIWQELLSFQSREFWEVNDRGAHLDFLTDEQKRSLGVFFGRVRVMQQARCGIPGRTRAQSGSGDVGSAATERVFTASSIAGDSRASSAVAAATVAADEAELERQLELPLGLASMHARRMANIDEHEASKAPPLPLPELLQSAPPPSPTVPAPPTAAPPSNRPQRRRRASLPASPRRAAESVSGGGGDHPAAPMFGLPGTPNAGSPPESPPTTPPLATGGRARQNAICEVRQTRQRGHTEGMTQEDPNAAKAARRVGLRWRRASMQGSMQTSKEAQASKTKKSMDVPGGAVAGRQRNKTVLSRILNKHSPAVTVKQKQAAAAPSEQLPRERAGGAAVMLRARASARTSESARFSARVSTSALAGARGSAMNAARHSTRASVHGPDRTSAHPTPASPPPPRARHDTSLASEEDDTLNESAPKLMSYPALLLPVAVFCLVVIVCLIDRESGDDITLLGRFVPGDGEQRRKSIVLCMVLNTAVLSCVLLVSTITMQICTSIYTSHITLVFLHDPKMCSLLISQMLCNTVTVVSCVTAIDGYGQRVASVFSTAACCLSLLLLFPYFSRLFHFFNPRWVICDQVSTLVNEVNMSLLTRRQHDDEDTESGQSIEHMRRKTLEGLEQVADFGICSVMQKQVGNLHVAIDELFTFGAHYVTLKAKMAHEASVSMHDQSSPSADRMPLREEFGWFRPSRVIALDEDFVGLDESTLANLYHAGYWVEWKLQRQLHRLFQVSLLRSSPLCTDITTSTSTLARMALLDGDVRAFDMFLQFLNTYMRECISARESRLLNNICDAYRRLAEMLLDSCSLNATEENPKANDSPYREDIEQRVVAMVRFIRYYLVLSLERGMHDIAEVMTHDIAALCEQAFLLNSPVHTKLLDILLTVDDTAESARRKQGGKDGKDADVTLRGMRRAQIKLATTYLLAGETGLARRIHEDMEHEPVQRLRIIWFELMDPTCAEFFEVSDRGLNVDFLQPEQKAQLPRYYSWFGQLQDDDDEAEAEVPEHPQVEETTGEAKERTKPQSAFWKKASAAVANNQHSLRSLRVQSKREVASSSHKMKRAVSRVRAAGRLRARRPSNDSLTMNCVSAAVRDKHFSR